MAADLAGAEALLAAARAGGLPLMVNWPTAWRPALRHGLALALAGRVGEPVQLSHRGGHAGPREFGCSPEFSAWLYDPARNGGGALVDYCGYGAVLARVLLGPAPRGDRGDGAAPEAGPPRRGHRGGRPALSAGARPPRGELDPDRRASRPSGWSSTAMPARSSSTSLGRLGTASAVGPGRVQVVTDAGSEMLEPPPLPERRARRADVLPDVPPRRPRVEGLCAPDVGRDVQEVLEAAQQASASGRDVELPAAPGQPS